nr:ribonuclease H-like domain-containing protein [Tanacetum cinerariifolium]
MRMEKKVLTRTVGTYKPTTIEEKIDRRNEIKARGTLLMALSNKDQLKFHSYQDAKLLMESIEKRYGGNKESKKVQRTLLKQQYENFSASSLDTLDQTFNRPQKLISQLEIQGENKAELKIISLDDLYNNLKIYEPELSRSSNKQNPQNMAFVFSNNTSSTNEANTTASGVNTAHTQEDLEQIDPDDLEEIDLHWEMAMLTIRARRFMKRTGRNLDMNGRRIGFDKLKVECFNCHKNGHFARECRAPKNQDNKCREYRRKTILVKSPTENALIAQDGIGGQVSDKSKAGLGYKEITPDSFVNSSEILEKQENRSDKEYHAVPSPLTRNYMPLKRNLRLTDEHFESVFVDVISNIAPSDVKTVKIIDVNHKGVFNTEEPKPIMKNNFIPLIIEDWHLDDESEEEISPTVEVKIVKPSIEKIKYVKHARETVKTKESPKQQKHHPRGNQQNWNNLMSQRLGRTFKMINKACYVCGSFEHLQYDYDQKVVKPVWNNTKRVNHKNFAIKFTHSHPKRRFVPQAVLTRGKAILKLKELMELCTKLSDRVLDLEKIKTAQAKGIADLKKRVKKLERKRSSRTPRMNLFKIGTSRRRSLGKEDASKQGRNLKQRSIFKKSIFDVQAMIDADFELAVRLKAEKQRRKPLTKA